MRYQGICQCGNVAFEIEDGFGGAPISNSPEGPRSGTPLWRVPRDRLRVPVSEEEIGAYTFNERLVAHRFCPTCGVHLYGEEVGPNGSRTAYINLDCID